MISLNIDRLFIPPQRKSFFLVYLHFFYISNVALIHYPPSVIIIILDY